MTHAAHLAAQHPELRTDRGEDMKIPRRRVRIASERLVEAHAIAEAAEDERLPFAVACALAEKESIGRMVYGHDAGGAFSTAHGPVTIGAHVYPQWSDIPVTPTNFQAFLIKIGAGARSNGVGIAQVTYAGELADGRSGGYFRQAAEDNGLDLSRPVDNARFGFRILRGNYERTRDWATAFGHYNGGKVPDMEYGNDCYALLEAWRSSW